jgi:hypothetical protein
MLRVCFRVQLREQSAPRVSEQMQPVHSEVLADGVEIGDLLIDVERTVT